MCEDTTQSLKETELNPNLVLTINHTRAETKLIESALSGDPCKINYIITKNINYPSPSINDYKALLLERINIREKFSSVLSAWQVLMVKNRA